jgi:hypothetical protein
MGIETTAMPFLLAAGVSVVMSLYCLTLPHTPPEGKGQQITVGNLLGLDALVMLKKRPYLVFAVASILACIPLTFYFVFTNTFLNEVGVVNAAGKMTLGQFSEVGVMLLMPFIFRRITVRGVLGGYRQDPADSKVFLLYLAGSAGTAWVQCAFPVGEFRFREEKQFAKSHCLKPRNLQIRQV